MNETQNRQPDDAGLPPLEALLPWYATGRLSARDRAEVESALASGPDLRRGLAIAHDEIAETIALNEALPTPPAAAMDRLMAKIDLYEAQHPRRVSLAEKLFGWVPDRLAALSPQALAWSAGAAAIVICLQAGLLTGLVADRHAQSHYGTASVAPQAKTPGTFALISFVGTISAQEMTDFLTSHHVSLSDGPDGGLYTIKIANETLSREARDAKLAELRDSKIVSAIFAKADAQ